MAQGEDTKIHQPNGLARVAAALDGPGDYRQINQKLSQPQERSWREVEANAGNPVDHLDNMKEAYTNKKTGEIQNLIIKEVIDFVQTQKEALLASQSWMRPESHVFEMGHSRSQTLSAVAFWVGGPTRTSGVRHESHGS
ncbi:BnaA01g28940D [Brassica napus]|uniref:BnaA01g28940D protein n=1 Tax=Brassica napus TaxID=3708 RepID=A0A078G657_BRANA|nr:BnaA01g28940D [Brassica napus]